MELTRPSTLKIKLGKWGHQVVFTLAEHGFVRVLDAAITYSLVRILLPLEFGLYSVYQSWVAMLFLFLPPIELVLFRDYGLLKSQNVLGPALGAYRFFNFLKLIVAAVLVGALALVPEPQSTYMARFAMLALALALPFSQAFFSYLREPLRFEMRQAAVACLSLLQRALIILALWGTAKLFGATPLAITASSLIALLLIGGCWSFAARSSMKDVAGYSPEYWKVIKTSLLGVVIWIHINGVITQTLQTFDIFSLNYFKAPLAEIGRYNLALKAANFFQILPVALTSSYGVFLARRAAHSQKTDEIRNERQITLLLTAAFMVLCAALFALSGFVDTPLIAFLTRGKASDAEIANAVQYFKWQVAGVLLLCASHPVSTYLSARGNLKQILLFVNTPWFLSSVVIYLWSAQFGVLTTAKANVAVYGAAVALLLFLFSRTSKELAG